MGIPIPGLGIHRMSSRNPPVEGWFMANAEVIGIFSSFNGLRLLEISKGLPRCRAIFPLVAELPTNSCVLLVGASQLEGDIYGQQSSNRTYWLPSGLHYKYNVLAIMSAVSSVWSPSSKSRMQDCVSMIGLSWGYCAGQIFAWSCSS